MAHQDYKVVSIHVHEILGWTILSRPINFCAPYIGGIIGNVQSDLETLAFKNGVQVEYVCTITLIIQ